jgi:hypothetical protein
VSFAAVVSRRLAGIDLERRDHLIIALAYAASWGLLLVNRGLYWDDWTLVGRSSGSLVDTYREIGLPWLGYLFAALTALPLAALVGHVLVFATYLLSTVVLHAVLRRIPGLSRMDAFVAALTFAVLPVNYARIAMIDLSYAMSLLAFLVATWSLVRYLQDGRLRYRLAALVLFFVSFTTASLLVLYAVPLVLALWIARKTARPLRSFLPRHVDLVALPVVFWLLKAAFFDPSGVYDEYNALSLSGLARVPRALLGIPAQVLVEPLSRAITVAGLIGVAAGAVAAVWLVARSRAPESGTFVPALLLAAVGAVVLGLGVFAYLAVGRTPTIWDWSSRHQLLVPLGVGLLAAAVVRGVRGAGRAGPVFGVAVGLLLGISVVADLRTLVAYQVDWFKQTVLIEAARTLPDMRTARHIRVVDAATAFNALRRTYRFYEYNALFSVALGDTRRLASSETDDPSADRLGDLIARPAYHMGEYVPSPVDLELRVTSNGPPGAGQVLRLVLLEALGSPSFETEAARLIDVRAVPAAAAPAP